MFTLKRWACLALIPLLAVAGCRKSSSDGGMITTPPVMTITTPTAAPTYNTTAPSIVIGGTLTGLVAGDFFPFASTGGVRNQANGRTVGLRIEGNTDLATWEGTSALPLEFGDNEIFAWGDFNNGSVSDRIRITRN